jgi:hypothetical protein
MLKSTHQFLDRKEYPMKKLFFALFILVQICSVFAQQKYSSADGFYGYEFSDDFSKMTARILDSEVSSDSSNSIPTNILHYEKYGIPFWSIGNYEYIYFESDIYFILQNQEKQFILVKDGKWSEYWQKKVKPAIYEASTEQKDFFNNFEAFNLSQFNLNPWISESQTGGINEHIIIEANSNFSSFRIVNGFVDINNPDNFQSYNRVKTLKAYDQNENLIGTFELKDDSSIQVFNLEKEVNFVKFVVEEIYSGRIFSDVALTVLQCY